MVKHIIAVHHKIIVEIKGGRIDREIASESEIPLERFYQLLVNEDLNEVCNGESYFHYLLLKNAGRYFHQYCLDKNIEDSDTLLILNVLMSKINDFQVPELKKFIQSILPHRESSFKTVINFNDNSFDHEDFKYGLLKVFHQLKESKSNSDFCFYWEKGENTYLPTAIYLPSSHAEDLCVDIVKTGLNGDGEFFFETDKLINQDIDVESIFTGIQVGRLSILEESKELNRNRINSFKNIGLISLDKAKDIIND